MAKALTSACLRPADTVACFDRAALEGLVALLRIQSLSAMGRFVSLSDQLRRLLSESAYEVVRDHTNNLRFGDAADALEDIRR